MTERRRIDMAYEPRDVFQDFHLREQRRAILVCHRRAGKTVATINDIIMRASMCKLERPRYAFVFPYRTQAKDTAWAYLRKYSEPLWHPEKAPYENELYVTLINEAVIRLYGADNPDALRGPYLDGIVLDEFADMKPTVWDTVVRPMLADRHGWATFIGTPKGKNSFYDIWNEAKDDPRWFRLMVKASESGIIDDLELSEMKEDMPPDEYDQELECSFEAAIKGAFYADAMRVMLAEKRLGTVDINKDVRVHTAWDLGVSDSTAIWFIQCVGRERRLVDYYEASGVGIDHYVQVLHDKRMQHGWRYGDHYFPHDIKHREYTSGKSRVDTLAGMGIEATIVPESSVLDGINLVRRMLGRVWIDEGRCERGVEALRQYRREYDKRLKDWKQNPLHDWSSHGADALRTFACGFDDSSTTKPIKRPAPERPKGTHWSA